MAKLRSRFLLLVLAAIVALAGSRAWSQGETITQNFDGAPVGQVPAGWSAQQTLLAGVPAKPASWTVADEDGARVLKGVGLESNTSDMSYLVFDGAKPFNFDLSVKLKLVGTTLPDKHVWAGLVFRYQDEGNLYGAQMDWEDQERVAEIKYVLNLVDQQVHEIQTQHPFSYPTEWHTLRVRFSGTEGEMWFDTTQVWKGQNAMITRPGKVGLFVSNGATVLFDDFTCKVLPGTAVAPMADAFKSQQGWSIETVAKGGQYASQTSIGVGAETPYVAFFDQSKPAYQVANRSAGAWKAEAVADKAILGDALDSKEAPPSPLLSLRVDKEDTPHVLFVWKPADPGKARYGSLPMYGVRGPDGSWSANPIEVDKILAWYPVLDLSPEGKPFVAFLNWMDAAVHVAWQENGSWKNEVVSGTEKEVGRGSVFRIGFAAGAQELDFAYPNEMKDNLEVAWGRNKLYEVKKVPGDPPGGAWPSLARDSQGNLHIVHYSIDEQSLLYTRGAKGTFETQVVDQGGVVGLYPCIALDSKDRPHVAYYDGNTGTLKYAVLDGGKWTIQQTGAFGYYPSLALDAKGNPHISYYDPAAGSVRYATR